jgi:hypothetical protein
MKHGEALPELPVTTHCHLILAMPPEKYSTVLWFSQTLQNTDVHAEFKDVQITNNAGSCNPNFERSCQNRKIVAG